MADRFDYIIDTQEIKPFPGGQRFAAKLTRLVRNPGPNFERVNFMEYGLGQEQWGETQQEAYAKVEKEVKEWIAAQG